MSRAIILLAAMLALAGCILPPPGAGPWGPHDWHGGGFEPGPHGPWR